MITCLINSGCQLRDCANACKNWWGDMTARPVSVAARVVKLVSCPRNKHIFRCDQNGPPARREEGAYLERYVTDEQRGRRPIFIATLRAAASWLFFRVARSSRIDLDMLVARGVRGSEFGVRGSAFARRTC